MPTSSLPRDAVSVIAQEFKVDDPCALIIDIPKTYVRLRPGSLNNKLEVNFSVSGCSPEQAENVLDRMAVGTRQKKNAVHVHSNGNPSDARWWRWLRGLSASMHLDIHLPHRVNAEVRAPSGTIDVADLAGHLELEAMGGSVQTENLEGTLDVNARSSNVQVTHFTGEELDVRVAAGSLSIENASADTLTIRSTSAPVTLTNVNGTTDVGVNGAPLNLHDISGACTAESWAAPLTFVGHLEHETVLRAVGDSLETRLPSSLGADLTLMGEEVSLDTDFAFDGEQTPHQITGTLNGGGSILRCQAIRGSAHCGTQ